MKILRIIPLIIAFPAYANLGCECGVDNGKNRWMCQHPVPAPDPRITPVPDPNATFSQLEYDPWCDYMCSPEANPGNPPLPNGQNCTWVSSSSSSSCAPCQCPYQASVAALAPASTIPPVSIPYGFSSSAGN